MQDGEEHNEKRSCENRCVMPSNLSCFGGCLIICEVGARPWDYSKSARILSGTRWKQLEGRSRRGEWRQLRMVLKISRQLGRSQGADLEAGQPPQVIGATSQACRGTHVAGLEAGPSATESARKRASNLQDVAKSLGRGRQLWGHDRPRPRTLLCHVSAGGERGPLRAAQGAGPLGDPR